MALPNLGVFGGTATGSVPDSRADKKDTREKQKLDAAFAKQHVIGIPQLQTPIVINQPTAKPVSSVGAKYAQPYPIKHRSEKMVKLAVIRRRNNQP